MSYFFLCFLLFHSIQDSLSPVSAPKQLFIFWFLFLECNLPVVIFTSAHAIKPKRPSQINWQNENSKQLPKHLPHTQCLVSVRIRHGRSTNSGPAGTRGSPGAVAESSPCCPIPLFAHEDLTKGVTSSVSGFFSRLLHRGYPCSSTTRMSALPQCSGSFSVLHGNPCGLPYPENARPWANQRCLIFSCHETAGESIIIKDKQ